MSYPAPFWGCQIMPAMVLTPILLMILYPLSPALRLYEFVRWLLSQVLSWLEVLEEEDTATLIRIDAFLAIIEQFLHAIIGKLAAEQLGLTFRKKPSMGLMPRPQRGKSLSRQHLFGRFERLVQMFQDIDRLVARRADFIRRELDGNPLRLLTAFADTSPAGGGNIARNLGRLPPPRMWGRWPVASSRPDRGGACLLIRAPP